MKTQVLADLLGSVTLVNYIVAFIFVTLALIVKWIWKTIEAIINDEESPNKFILSYWLRRNVLPKFLTTVGNTISIFIILRFSSDLFDIKFSYLFSVVVGFTLDYWIDRLKKINPKIFIINKKLKN